jgi:hypothetical protein
MPYCAHCGNEISEGYLCVACQKKLLSERKTAADSPKFGDVNAQKSTRYQPDPDMFPDYSGPTQKPKKGIASMILAIIAFFTGILFSIIGIILGIVSYITENKNNYALAGIFIGIISMIYNIIILIFFLPTFLSQLPY